MQLVTTLIKDTVTLVASNVRKILHMSTKQDLEWERCDSQTERNKDH